MHEWLTRTHWLPLEGWESEAIGYVAAALVLTAFAMKSIRPLRITAISSNVAFIGYALVTDTRPILVLHAILLPLNLFRLTQREPGSMPSFINFARSKVDRGTPGRAGKDTTRASHLREAAFACLLFLTAVTAAAVISTWMHPGGDPVAPLADWPPGSI